MHHMITYNLDNISSIHQSQYIASWQAIIWANADQLPIMVIRPSENNFS